jgi:hypothetical protein
MALRARPQDASALVVKQTVSLLFGVEPLDPLSFGLTIPLFLVTAVMASYLPIRRAARIDHVPNAPLE